MPRIVLVNDDPTQLAMAAGLLSKDGFDVTRFLSSEEALEACRTLPADLVVSDLNMPGLRGEQLLEALRLLPAYASTPVILVSASAPKDELAARCETLLAGHGLLLAPYRLSELRRLTRSYLGQETAPEVVAAPISGDFDPEPVRKLKEAGGMAFAGKIVGMFLSKVPANLEALQVAYAAADWETAERLAHSTRGSAGMVGALRVSELAGELEQAAGRRQAGSLEPMQAAFAEVKARLEGLLEAG